MDFKELNISDFSNVFDKMNKDWMLITAGKEGSENTMTASWGALGILWHKPVCICFVRPQRYTHKLIEECDTLSCTFFGEEYRKVLQYCGTKSGADTDKIADCGLTVLRENDTPYFAEASAALLCRKLYVGQMKEEDFLNPYLLERHYKIKDYHTVYICEIEKVLIK